MCRASVRNATLVLLFAFPSVLRADSETMLGQAKDAWQRRDYEGAITLAGKAITANPKDPICRLLRGQMYSQLGKHTEAIADLDSCIKLDPKLAVAYDLRGSELFKQAKIAESLADFDRFLQLNPQAAPEHWKRGISLYYLGKYAEGAKQFNAYEKVDTNDVENAVWHFMCNARAVGEARARQEILKIGRDRRVPLMEVYALFKGEAKPADVLAAANAGNVSAERRKDQLFYAHLYLGLYYDMLKDTPKALEHLDLAAGKYRLGHYMGDVADVHAQLLRKK